MELNSLQSCPPTWCPGCGNFGIWAALKNALVASGMSMEQFVIVYGVGCSGNMNDFIKCHGFHSLHGRSIPNAVGIKLANHQLKVICVVGDGDFYGEGGNHFIHAVRGNHDIMVIVHDNRVYGLTTGQTAPTSFKGFKSKSTPLGSIERPVNGLAAAIIQGASFVARGYAGNVAHLTSLFTSGIKHQGFALIDVLQPCVTFNKLNSYSFYQDKVYVLDQNYDVTNKQLALEKAMEENKFPTGILFKEDRKAYHQEVAIIKDNPLVQHEVKTPDLSNIFNSLA